MVNAGVLEVRMEGRVKALEDKIRNYDKYVFAAVIVAVIFGISGAWGLSLISNAKDEITKLNGDISNAEGKVKDFEATLETFSTKFGELILNAKGELSQKSEELSVALSTEMLSALQTEIERAGEKLSKITILSGYVHASSNDIPKFPGGDCVKGDAGHRGLKGHWVPFSEKFASPPQVLISLSAITMQKGATVRIVVKRKDVTEEGFSLNLTTYCDTDLVGASAMWIAVGQ